MNNTGYLEYNLHSRGKKNYILLSNVYEAWRLLQVHSCYTRFILNNKNNRLSRRKM